MQELRKIVVTGPESTGKSSLCQLLAKHYKTVWCPEYAREYLLTHGSNYTYNDLLTIAKGQIALEEEFANKAINMQKSLISASKSPLLIIDTNMYVMKVWCEYVFGKCHSYILDKIAERKYDLYLLCDIDLPWKKDELREHPDIGVRRELFNIYKDILTNQTVPWAIVSGNYKERLETAIAGIEKLLTAKF